MPSPQSVEMDFPEAIRKVTAGQRVSRLAWMDLGTYILLRDGFLSIKNAQGFHRLLVSDGDLLATDWIVVDGFEYLNPGPERAVSGQNN